jgi:hypothetical protein
MPLHVYDGTAWRLVTAPSVYDGTAWRTITELHVYDGTAWREVFTPAASDNTATITDSSSTAIGGGDWEAAVQYSVGTDTNSVQVHYDNGGGVTHLETVNVTPGSTGNWTTPVAGPFGPSGQVWISVTPYTSAGGIGSAGTAATLDVYAP